MQHILAGCLFAFSAVLTAACAPQPQPTRCNAPSGWEVVADAAHGKTLMIGEIHGTHEIPKAFASYVCAVANRGGPVWVGLEMSDIYADAFQTASITDNPRQALLDKMDNPLSVEGVSSHWAVKDGRGSHAMLEAMEVLFHMDNVKVVPFVPSQIPGLPEGEYTAEEIQAWFDKIGPTAIQQNHEEAMALLLREKIRKSETVIILIGSLHASKARFESFPVDPMAMFLGDDTLTLKAQFDAGEAWSIQSMSPDADADAGAFSVNADRKGVPSDARPHSMGFSSTLLPHYDGYFYVGPITASPPVIGD